MRRSKKYFQKMKKINLNSIFRTVIFLGICLFSLIFGLSIIWIIREIIVKILRFIFNI